MTIHLRKSLAFLLFLIPVSAPAENPPPWRDSWGTFGSEAGQLWYPAGLSVVPGCECLLVAEVQNHRVQKFSLTGTSLDLWGGPNPGTATGEFSNPSDVVVDGSSCYVLDTANNRVQKFTTAGAFVAAWGTGGTGNGQFDNPTAMARAPNGDLYIADTQNHRVQRMTTSGGYVLQWGANGTGTGQFRYPGGVGVDGAGNVFVSDSANDRIQKFDGNGGFISVIVTGTQVNNPLRIAVDPSGNLYVADHDNHRVQKFSGTGALLTTIGSFGQGDGQFVGPNGVALDNAGGVFVSDGENRIQKFSTMVAVRSSTWGRLKALYP